MLLAGDIGGTKTRLALYEISGSGSTKSLKRLVVEKFDSKSASNFESIVSAFLNSQNAMGKVEAACVGVAGPVSGGTVKATNLPWFLHDKQLSSELKIGQFKLVNDLVATIASVPNLASSDLVTLHAGKPERETNVVAMVAPGTGLGQGYMYRDERGHWHPLPSEGGHVEFAPKDDLEFDLLKYMQRRLKKRVSVERVLSGPGLVNIYAFLKDLGYSTEPVELRQELADAADPAAIIAQRGISGEFEICVRSLDIFCGLLGSHAGDAVLTYLSTGGLYLGGGIPPKIVSHLEKGVTVSSYLKKGRMSVLVEATPLCVIKDDHAALLGAATIASQLCS